MVNAPGRVVELMRMPSLAVVVLNWNRLAATRRCVEALLGWRRLEPEVWVVDNGSHNGEAAALAAAFPTVRVLAAGRNLGFGGGNNLALRQTEAPFALLLNNDAGLEEEDAARLLGALEVRGDLAVVGPLITDRSEAARVQAAGGRDISRYARTNLRPGDLPPDWLRGGKPYPVDYVPGTVALLRLTPARQVGLLDERYFFGGEMADLCRRLRDLGWSCAVEPAARAWHERDGSAPERQRLDTYYILRNRFLFLREHGGGARRWRAAAWVAYGTAGVLRDLLAGDGSRAGARAAALRDGVAGRFGGWAGK